MFLDKEEIKFTIIYAIACYETPISREDLASILVWDKGILEYFDLQTILSELIEDKFIEEKFHIDENMCSLTAEGSETNRLFKNRIPQSIRDRIDDAIGKIKYERFINPSDRICEIVPISENQYMARINIIENKIPLIDCSIYIGGRKEAEETVRYFRSNSEEVYQKILDIATEKREKKE